MLLQSECTAFGIRRSEILPKSNIGPMTLVKSFKLSEPLFLP